jgi:hypothetical protein
MNFQEKFHKWPFINRLKYFAEWLELMPGFKNNSKTRRKEIVEAPKYAFVT